MAIPGPVVNADISLGNAMYMVLKDIVDHLEERSGSDCELEVHLLDYLRAKKIIEKYESEHDT